MKFFFLSAGTRRLDLAIRRILGIKNDFLVFDPLSHYECPPDQCNGMWLFIYLLTQMGAGLKKDLRVSRVRRVS